MTSRECETCIKRKTVYCPNSIECMATDDKPYYQNRIMLLEENQELKKQLEATKKVAEENLKRWVIMKNQQKEFIKYLEDEKDRLARICNNLGENKFDEADDILQKYKEIIGDDKE